MNPKSLRLLTKYKKLYGHEWASLSQQSTVRYLPEEQLSLLAHHHLNTQFFAAVEEFDAASTDAVLLKALFVIKLCICIVQQMIEGENNPKILPSIQKYVKEEFAKLGDTNGRKA